MHVQYQQQALGPGRNGEHGSSTSSMQCTGLWSKEHTGHAGSTVVVAVLGPSSVVTGALVTIALVVVQAAQSYRQHSMVTGGQWSRFWAFCVTGRGFWVFAVFSASSTQNRLLFCFFGMPEKQVGTGARHKRLPTANAAFSASVRHNFRYSSARALLVP